MQNENPILDGVVAPFCRSISGSGLHLPGIHKSAGTLEARIRIWNVPVYVCRGAQHQKRSSLRRNNFQPPTYSITSSVSVADGRKRTDSPILTQQNNLLASGRDCSANHKGRRPPYKDRPSHFDV